MRRALCLAHLTIGEVAPPDVPAIAAAAGFESITLRMSSPRPDVPSPPMIGDTSMRRATQQALRDRGVRLLTIEAVLLRPDTDPADYEGLFDSAACLGAQGALVVGLDPDHARLADRFAALAELALAYQLGLELEFMAFSEVKSLDQALDVVRRSGAKRAGVIVDALHLQRTGGSPCELAKVDAAHLAGVQLCDGPATIAPARLIEEARCDRDFIGEGVFPLAALLEATPANVPVALEIPAERLRHLGHSPLARAKRAHDSFRRVFG